MLCNSILFFTDQKIVRDDLENAWQTYSPVFYNNKKYQTRILGSCQSCTTASLKGTYLNFLNWAWSSWSVVSLEPVIWHIVSPVLIDLWHWKHGGFLLHRWGLLNNITGIYPWELNSRCSLDSKMFSFTSMNGREEQTVFCLSTGLAQLLCSLFFSFFGVLLPDQSRKLFGSLRRVRKC